VKVPELLPSLAFGAFTTLLILPGRGGGMGRWRGFVLLAMYALYVAMTLHAEGKG
jgi:Ca2+/Na+ antiporter